jgi:hypothetical protein
MFSSSLELRRPSFRHYCLKIRVRPMWKCVPGNSLMTRAYSPFPAQKGERNLSLPLVREVPRPLWLLRYPRWYGRAISGNNLRLIRKHFPATRINEYLQPKHVVNTVLLMVSKRLHAREVFQPRAVWCAGSSGAPLARASPDLVLLPGPAKVGKFVPLWFTAASMFRLNSACESFSELQCVFPSEIVASSISTREQSRILQFFLLALSFLRSHDPLHCIQVGELS